MAEFTLKHMIETGSTNDDMKELVRKESHPVYACLWADIQTGGKGRRGRAFVSPEGGIYFSFTVPLSGNETNPAFLTSIAGLYTARSITRATGLDVKIKWPNDIYVSGKKVCGMLAELVTDCTCPAIVMGIGINNRHIEFPDEIKNRAASLEDCGAYIADGEAFIREVVSSVYRSVYECGELNKAKPETVDALRLYSCSIGRKAQYGDNIGTVIDINPDGSVKMNFGGVEKDISTGEILHFEDSSC